MIAADRMKRVLDKVRGNIDRYGWSIQGVGGEARNPGYSYTIGFTETLKHPEVYIVGFHPEMAHSLLNDVGRLIREGADFRNPVLCDKVIMDYDVAFRPATPETVAEVNNVGRVVLGRLFPAVQMFLPDPEGRFPWDQACDPNYKSLQTSLLDISGDIPTARWDEIKPGLH